MSVKINDKTVCAASGDVSSGATCTHLISSDHSFLTFDEFLDFLSARPESPDHTIPAKGAAMCMSANDWGKMKLELETACRLLGKKCSYELSKTIENLGLELDHND